MKTEEEMVIPPEVLDLVRFMCDTWAQVDEWAYQESGDADAITSYPVIQGTRNQLNLLAIGGQEYDSARVAYAVKWMLDN